MTNFFQIISAKITAFITMVIITVTSILPRSATNTNNPVDISIATLSATVSESPSPLASPTVKPLPISNQPRQKQISEKVTPSPFKQPTPTTLINQPVSTLIALTPTPAPTPISTPTPSYTDLHCPIIIKAEIEDNFGSISDSSVTKEFKSGNISQITAKITATDPQGLPLHYQFLFGDLETSVSNGPISNWTTNNVVTINIPNPNLGIRTGWIRVDNQDGYGCIGAYYDTQINFKFNVTP